jgi:hypothetical protein
MVVEDFEELVGRNLHIPYMADNILQDDSVSAFGKPPSWFSRNILRRTSSTHSVRQDRHIKHKRSISDLSVRLKLRKDKLKDKDLQELTRLCGSSLLYLPAEYAVGSLAVPTCFRATAQYLVQHGRLLWLAYNNR